MTNKELAEMLDDTGIYPKAKDVLYQLDLFFRVLRDKKITNDSIGWMVDSLAEKTAELHKAAEDIQAEWWI